MPVIPGWDPPILLVIAEAGVDDDPPSRRLDHERMNAQLERSALVGEMRDWQGDGRLARARGLGQDDPAAAGRLELHDLGDSDVADLPLHRRSPLSGVSISTMRGLCEGPPGRCARR